MWGPSIGHKEAQQHLAEWEVVAGGAQQEPRRVCSSKALLWHNAGARTVLQRRGQLRACLFMGIEALVAAVRLRELSLASACSDAVCGFIGVRHSHNTLLHTVGWYLPATFQP